MKKFILSFVFMMLVFTSVVNANTIYSIDMDIYINKSGDAEVTEVWECLTTEGKEFSHPYYNLGKSEISKLKVADEDGIEYQLVDSWDEIEELSFSQFGDDVYKIEMQDSLYMAYSLGNEKYKCGLNKNNNDIEICWGISEYGKKTYTVNYKISNFVVGLLDSQMIYFMLIPPNFYYIADNAEITIRADEKFADKLEVFGYGNEESSIYVQDGVVKMHSKGNLYEDDYMFLLIKFPVNTFDTDVKYENNFELYKKNAKANARDDSEIIRNVFEFIAIIICLFVLFEVIRKLVLIESNVESEEVLNEYKKK